MAMKSFGAMSQGFQAIAAEVANYSKKSFEDHAAAMQKIMGAKSIEKAMELQTEYIKQVY
jgi:phasin family protein